MSNLEDLTDEIDATCDELVGETITYIPSGRAMLRPQAHVFYSDGNRDIGAGQAIEQDIMIHIRKALLPTQPASGDRIQLKRHPGKTFRPTNPTTDDSGTYWVCNLLVVR